MPKIPNARKTISKANGVSSRPSRLFLAIILVGLGVGLVIIRCISVSLEVNHGHEVAVVNSQMPYSAVAAQAKTKTGPPTGPSVGLTVVHCNENWNRMSWLEEVPSHWKLIVFETCGEETISHASQPFNNAGPEECTGYLQTIIEHYDNLQDINIFLQSDALIGRGRSSKTYNLEHSPFKTISELINATMEYSPTWKGSHFLHYGPKVLRLPNVNAKETFMDYHPRDVLDIMQMPYLKVHEENNPRKVHPNATRTHTRAGACFAVTPDRIRSRPVGLYKKLQDSVYETLKAGGKNEVRKRCCAMEQLWHAILGGPYLLPLSDTVDHLWDAKLNYYEGEWQEHLRKQQGEQPQQ